MFAVASSSTSTVHLGGVRASDTECEGAAAARMSDCPFLACAFRSSFSFEERGQSSSSGAGAALACRVQLSPLAPPQPPCGLRHARRATALPTRSTAPSAFPRHFAQQPEPAREGVADGSGARERLTHLLEVNVIVHRDLIPSHLQLTPFGFDWHAAGVVL